MAPRAATASAAPSTTTTGHTPGIWAAEPSSAGHRRHFEGGALSVRRGRRRAIALACGSRHALAGTHLALGPVAVAGPAAGLLRDRQLDARRLGELQERRAEVARQLVEVGHDVVVADQA